MGSSANGHSGRPAVRHHWEWPGGLVTVDLDGCSPPNVQLTLENLAARRLLLALGMNGRRHGPEVKAITDGLAVLLIGYTSGEETAHPHGPGHACPNCRLLRPLHPGSVCCNTCFWETPEQFMEFPTQCPHRIIGGHR